MDASWPEPKLGWTSDQALIARREKDLDKGYASDVYKRYSQEISRCAVRSSL